MPSLLPPQPPQLAETLSELRADPRGVLRRALRHLGSYSRDLLPPPSVGQPVERVIYGMAQPLLGARVLLRDRDLLTESLKPALLLGAVCALVALANPLEGPLWLGRLKRFYQTFAVLAPLPSILFARHYARLAALVRFRLGFGACGPREYPLTTSIRRTVEQALIVAIGAAPFIVIPSLIPLIGKAVVAALLAFWGLHWVVVDAFDDARVLWPGESLGDAEAEDRAAPNPWFVRWFNLAADKLDRLELPLLTILPKLLRRFARFCDKLSLPWRGEIALLEAHPMLALGFSITTAAVLATPGLNLLFRPIIIVASSHLLGHLEAESGIREGSAAGPVTMPLS